MSQDQNELFSAKSELLLLFNFKQYEELFLIDKSEKLKQDIEIKENSKIAKEKEKEFYKTLLLEKKRKENFQDFQGMKRKVKQN